MMKQIIAALLLLSIATTAPAWAMTCDDFRNALAKSIADAGDRVAQPTLDKIAFQRADGSFHRIKLEGIVGLQGDLQCEPGNSFHMFNVSVEIDGREDVLKLYRLHELSAATICAMSPSLKISACRQRDRRLSAAALNEFAKSKVRGDPDPSSFEKATIGNFEFEYDAAEGSLDFSVVPAVKWEPGTGH